MFYINICCVDMDMGDVSKVGELYIPPEEYPRMRAWRLKAPLDWDQCRDIIDVSKVANNNSIDIHIIVN